MYFYLEKTSLINGNLTVIFQTENRIDNYREITNFGELVEYHGENIPAQWEFDGEHFYDLADKPSPYHRLNEHMEWVVTDLEALKKYCEEVIDKIKEQVLEYGFDYEVKNAYHRQRCRDKDIAFMGTSMTYLIGENMIGNNTATTPWYFEDNFEHQFNLQELVIFARYGKTFIESVYKTENYFKTLETPKVITEKEFEDKRTEVHQVMVGG